MLSLKYIAALSLVALPALAEFDPNVEYPLEAGFSWDYQSYETLVLSACGRALSPSYNALAGVYPNVGATSLIQDILPTDLCGSCWTITDANTQASINVVMMDTIPGTSINDDTPRFSVTPEAMQSLQGVYPEDHQKVYLAQVDASVCGM